jgi:glycerol kinase
MERMKFILAIDQGTTNTKVLLLDHTGAVRARASRPLAITYPKPGWVAAMRQDAPISTTPVLLADGGASSNNQLMQFQADIPGCPVVRSSSTDLSAIGAAWLAGLATGHWSSLEEVERLPRQTERFEPRMSESQRASLLGGWQDALRRTMSSLGAQPEASLSESRG